MFSATFGGVTRLIRGVLSCVFILLGVVSCFAQGSTLPNLSAGGPVSGGDLFYDVQTPGVGGVKVTGSQIASFVNSLDTLTIGTTPITGGVNGDCLFVNSGMLGQTICGSLTIGVTPVTGGTNGNCLSIVASKVGQQACGGGGSTSILNITRAQIPSTNLGAGVTIMVNGYRTPNDAGFGAIYSSANSPSCTTGLMFIKDSAGNCFVMLTPQNGYYTGWFGAPTDNGATTITAGDITANPQWKGTYSAGQTWDYVGVQEAIYATWATLSTPGNIIWNVNNSQINNILNFSPGLYGINKTLFSAMSGFIVHMPPKNGTSGTSLVWTGAAGTGTIWKFDSASYGQFFNFNLNCASVSLNFVSGATSPPDIPCALFTNDGSSPGGLLTQQITFYDSVVSVGHQSGGIAFNPGSNIQGDTITFINPIFIGDGGTSSYYGLEVGGDNSLEYVLINGDFQGFPYFAIKNGGGQVFTYGTHFESQNQNAANVSPQLNQLTTEGADLWTDFSVSSDNPSVLFSPREEAEILTRADAPNAYTNIYNGISIGADAFGPFTNYTGYQAGMPVFGLGTKQRAFMVVDNGGFCSQWCTITSNNGNATITDSTASYAVNSLTSKVIFMRFGSNGFTYHCGIASNTATTITIANTCANLPVSSESKYQIGGAAGGSLPNWDSVGTGYRTVCRVAGCASASTAVTTAGSSCIGIGSDPGISVGDWLVLPNADLLAPAGSPNFSWPFYAKVTAKAAGACPSGLATPNHVTVNKNATVTADLGANSLDFFGGPPLADGNITWIHFDYDGAQAAQQIQGLTLAGGYLSPSVLSAQGYAPAQKDFAYSPDLTSGQFQPNGANQANTFILNGSQQVWNCQPPISATIDLTNCIASSNVIQVTPSGNTTLNAPLPANAYSVKLKIIIAGGSGNITFGNNFSSNGVLVDTGGNYAVDFVSTITGNGFGSLTWVEVARSQLPPGALLQTVIASLPSCAAGTLGMLAVVTNGVASPTYNAAVSATGTTNDLVFCNATGWTYH